MQLIGRKLRQLWILILRQLAKNPKWQTTSFTGLLGEQIAAAYLEEKKYCIIARNLHFKIGEIDILAQTPNGQTIVIVEVKSRANNRDDVLQPEVHVNQKKQRKLTNLAAILMKQQKFKNRRLRFDVIGVDVPTQGEVVVRHYIAAFESNR